MKLEKISPAVEGGASAHLSSERAFYSRKAAFGQGISGASLKRIPPLPPPGQLAPDGTRLRVEDWRKALVSAGLFDTVKVRRAEGPIHLIGAPLVVIAKRGAAAIVFMARKPWGWPDPTMAFLNARSSVVGRYVKSLLIRIRSEAEKKARQKERARTTRSMSEAEIDAVAAALAAEIRAGGAR